MDSLISRLKDKDSKNAYEAIKQICILSAESDEYYAHFEEFVSLLSSSNSYERTRGFILCSAQARWDNEGKLEKALPSMLLLLHDKKTTVVRQCFSALHEVAIYRPELDGKIYSEIVAMDLSSYKDSMSPLIHKDIEELVKLLI